MRFCVPPILRGYRSGARIAPQNRSGHPLQVGFALIFGGIERAVEPPDLGELFLDPGLQFERVERTAPGLEGLGLGCFARTAEVVDEPLAGGLWHPPVA